MKNILIALVFFFIVPFLMASDQRAAIESLLDGLHKDTHEGNFQTYYLKLQVNQRQTGYF